MSAPVTQARCGKRMATHARRGHERTCEDCAAVPKRPSPYAVRPCAGCGRPFKPQTSTHRVCSGKCQRKKSILEPDNAERTVAEMRVINAKTLRLRDREIVSAWALEQRRPRVWAAWVTCLGLPEAMKEAA